MSIQPEYAERILAGEKRVEFRRTRFRSEVSHVVVYSTDPVRRLVGYFEVKAVEADKPDNLWRRYSRIAGLGRVGFDAYYEGCKEGTAIRIGRVFRFAIPVPLTALPHVGHPPQSFRYLDARVFGLLSERETADN